MALLTLTGIAKQYEARRPLLREVSMVVRSRDRIGLIGANGSGKSTLLRILAGLELPDAGSRVQRRGLRIGYLEQEPRLPGERSLRALVREGLASAPTHDRTESELEYRVEAAIDAVGLPDPDVRCATLSGGEARRVALARSLIGEPDLLLLDEPTNHLDPFVVAWLERRLAALRLPMVLITHDRYLLDRVANRILELDRGRLHGYEGGYQRFVELRSARLESEERAERSRSNLLRRERAWMRAGAPARSTKAKARIARYQELEAAAPLPPEGELELRFPPGPRLGTKVLRLEGVRHAYGPREVLPLLDLELRPGMRLGVVGPNGAGKTTLLRILLGSLTPTAGERIVGDTVRFATVDQRREDLDPEATVVEEVAGRSDHVSVAGRPIHVMSFLDRFLFPGARKDLRIASLSGGERGRVLLAKLMLRGGNLLVLDEPTNDLDLPTLRALEEALCAFAGTVVVVSHDRWFLDRVATHILYLNGRGGVRLHTGDASSLLESLEREETAAKGSRAAAARSSRPRRAAAPSEGPGPHRALRFRERRELESLLERIAELEEELAEVDARLGDPVSYRGPAPAARELQERRHQIQEELEDRLARWEELAARET